MGLTQSDCFAIQFCMELHSGKKCIVIEKKMQLLRANWNSFLLKTFLQSDIFKVDNLEANLILIQRNILHYHELARWSRGMILA